MGVGAETNDDVELVRKCDTDAGIDDNEEIVTGSILYLFEEFSGKVLTSIPTSFAPSLLVTDVDFDEERSSIAEGQQQHLTHLIHCILLVDMGSLIVSSCSLYG